MCLQRSWKHRTKIIDFFPSLETAMKKRWTLADLSAENTDSSPSLSSREQDSDSYGDSSDDDVLLCTLIRSKPSLARSIRDISSPFSSFVAPVS